MKITGDKIESRIFVVQILLNYSCARIPGFLRNTASFTITINCRLMNNLFRENQRIEISVLFNRYRLQNS